MSKITKDLRAEDMSTMHKRPDEENPGKKEAYQKPKDTKSGKVAQLYALLEELKEKYGL